MTIPTLDRPNGKSLLGYRFQIETIIAFVSITLFFAPGPLFSQEIGSGTHVQLSDQTVTQPPLERLDKAAELNGSSTTPIDQPSECECDSKSANSAKPSGQMKRDALMKKVATAHKGLFYNNDFSYLYDPDFSGHNLGDRAKYLPMPFGGCLSLGGQTRLRAHFEQNMRGLGLTGNDDEFLLFRTRFYANWEFSENLRVYGEMLDADSRWEDFTPRPIEENRFDLQNLFVDARLLSSSEGDLMVRVGRQELLYGAQRNVTPLDWANTRLTFEGIKLAWERSDFQVDGFWVQPMRRDRSSLDAPDQDQEFMGLYSTFSGRKDQTVDLFFLRYLNGRGANNFEYNTIGSRWAGGQGDFLWEFEGAYQFGENTDGSSHVAGMATFGLGRKLSNRCWQPTLWAYYDWASGDDATGAGNGFHHNFPLAHKYNGFMDLFGRRNLEDANVLLTLQPNKKLKLLAWYHYLFLETKTDTPYSVAMTPFNAANLPGSADLGHEIDFVASYSLSPRKQLLLGYSHFFSGDYYSATAGVPFTGDADFWYGQWTFNF